MRVALTPLLSKKVDWLKVAMKVADEKVVLSANCRLNRGLPFESSSGPGPRFPSETLMGPPEAGVSKKDALLKNTAFVTGELPVKFIRLNALVPGTGRFPSSEPKGRR